jgi:ATP phosphoribosyltransferase regulatory subunit
MSLRERWLLPEGIDELMPDQAAQLETLRRKLVDKMQGWGYQLVFPPLVEYLDSLLTGTGKSLDLQTFKLTDQLSGRMLGIRADMTPQVARMAAHNLRNTKGTLRLCYIGNVLHTLPDGQGTSRNPIQLGAEVYGHSGPESDLEIIELMVDTINIDNASKPLLLDLGHVGIYRGLAAFAGLNTEQEQELFAALQRKAIADIESLLDSYELNDDSRLMLLALAELNGDASVIENARAALSKAPDSVQAALDQLQTISSMITERLPNVALNLDLAELRGYHYHTGLVFAAYQLGSAQAIAMGGRYDDIGKDFGQAQPATGFSLDLRSLLRQAIQVNTQKDVISVRRSDDPKQKEMVASLRTQGEIVMYQLSDEDITSKQLIEHQGHWIVTETGTQKRG